MELKSNTQYIMHNIKDALTNSPNASGYLCVMKMKKKIIDFTVWALLLFISLVRWTFKAEEPEGKS